MGYKTFVPCCQMPPAPLFTSLCSLVRALCPNLRFGRVQTCIRTLLHMVNQSPGLRFEAGDSREWCCALVYMSLSPFHPLCIHYAAFCNFDCWNGSIAMVNSKTASSGRMLHNGQDVGLPAFRAHHLVCIGPLYGSLASPIIMISQKHPLFVAQISM